MFLAVLAFMSQGALISISQAAAAAGTMLEPAVTLSGSLHLHDRLAGHVHDHGGSNVEGHVHDSSGPDHDGDGSPASSFWSMFGVSVAVPSLTAFVHPSDFIGRVEQPLFERVDGIDPSALIRPPSTPSIA